MLIVQHHLEQETPKSPITNKVKIQLVLQGCEVQYFSTGHKNCLEWEKKHYTTFSLYATFCRAQEQIEAWVSFTILCSNIYS